MLTHDKIPDGTRPGVSLTPCGFLVAALLTASCGHGHLVPGKSAHLIAEGSGSAVDVDNGVRVVATCDDQHDLQARLPDSVTPIKVRIVNHSDHSLRVLYERFTLKARDGKVYRALPVVPLDHDGFVDEVGPVRPLYAAENFQVAPRYGDVYPSLTAWPTPLARDEASYEETYHRWGRNHPTREVRRMALPEGVLGPGGVMAGYLYFESPIDSERRLTFTADLESGRSGSSIAEIAIPLRVD